jgi:hypothetical protein
MDPKLVAGAFGMNPEGVLIYLADTVHEQYLSHTGDHLADKKTTQPARRSLDGA